MGTTSTEVDSPVSGLTTRMLRAIEWYQQQRTGALSPCRFFPSCSEYAHDAITLHGPWRGGWLAVRRLTRCRPFGPSGYDPVPDRQDHAHRTAHRTAHQPHAHETACCAHHSHHEETSNV